MISFTISADEKKRMRCFYDVASPVASDRLCLRVDEDHVGQGLMLRPQRVFRISHLKSLSGDLIISAALRSISPRHRTSAED